MDSKKTYNRRATLLMLVILIAGSLVSCGPKKVRLSGSYAGPEGVVSEESSAAPKWQARPEGEVAPGYEIEIQRADDPKVNGRFRVGADGLLKLPYDVQVMAEGNTIPQLQAAVRDAFKSLFKSPSMVLSVSSKDYYVNVRGLVKKPGQYLLKADGSLDDLISKSDGLIESTTSPNQSQAQYARIEQFGVTSVVKLRDYFSGQKGLTPKWQGGETVFFQSERGDLPVAGEAGRNYVQVLGQVKNPGEYPVTENADIFSYLIKAGGPTERADLQTIMHSRIVKGGREVTTFALEDADTLPSIKAGDTIIFHSDVPGAVEKNTRVIGGVASIITTIATVIILALTL